MTELELFGYAIIFATGICATIWLLVAACIIVSVWEWARGKHEPRRNCTDDAGLGRCELGD